MTQLIVWLNAIANACASVLLAPVASLPGWLSATLVAAVTGVLMLVVFKHTSNQPAIKRARAAIKANLLALSLFKESVLVSLRSQRRILVAVAKLLLLSFVPMLVMFVPITLALFQLTLWYQARPIRVGEEAVVTVKLADGQAVSPLLATSSDVETTVGPVRVPSKNMVCWNVRARQDGVHRLAFDVGGRRFEKEIVVGDGFMPVSRERPGWSWEQALENPRETPFPPDARVESIAIDYPQRPGWACGTNTWVFYWFIAAMVVAFAVKPILKVNL
jgi:hypothetical protein